MFKLKTFICLPLTIKADSQSCEWHKIFCEQLKAAPYSNIIELRFPLFNLISIRDIKDLLKSVNKPLLIGDDLKQNTPWHDFKNAIEELNPDYVSWEFSSDIPKELSIELLKQRKCIVTYHSQIPFETIEQVHGLINQIRQTYPDATYVKIAIACKNSIDVFQLLKMNNHQTIAIPMGENGSFGRALLPLFNCPISFAPADNEYANAPGQMPITELVHKYKYPKLNASTQILGLLGFPVDLSFGDVIHNAVLDKLNKKAIYIKIPLHIDELPSFFDISQNQFTTQFLGFSVTMPLKETIVPHLKELSFDAHQIGAVNTIVKVNGVWIGSNTDGIGALNALEDVKPVINQHIVILGAGATAKAIAYEAKKRGAHVTIVNRTYSKAKFLADKFSIECFKFDDLPSLLNQTVNILINATNVGMTTKQSLVDKHSLKKSMLVMDVISNPKKTKLLKDAEQIGCTIISGQSMLLHQAVEQYRYWYNIVNEAEKKDLLATMAKSLT